MPVPRRSTARRRKPTSATTRRTTKVLAKAGKPLKITVLQPRFKAQPRLALSKTRKIKMSALPLATIHQAIAPVAALKMKYSEVGGYMEAACKGFSAPKQVTFARAMIANWKTDEDVMTHSQAMTNWARIGDSKRRKMVCKAFNESGESGLLVHNIGGMERTNARAMMKDYFSAGGSIGDVMEWLSEAGEFLRLYSEGKTGTDGIFGKIVKAGKKIGKGVVDWTTAAVNTVSDALKAAGKNLARAIKETASWTVSKITGVVVGLLRAGRRVGDLLKEAARRGALVLRKYTRAILAAGRKIREVLIWAASKATSTLNTILRALDEARKSVRSIVQEAVRATGTVLLATVRAMMRMGKKLLDVVKAMAGMVFSHVKALVGALLKAGKSVLNIVKDTIRFAASAVTHLVRALMSLGQNLGEILFRTFNRITFGHFKKLLQAAMAAGQRITHFINAGISRGWVLLRKIAQGLSAIGQKAGALLSAAANKATAAVREIVKGLRAAGRSVAHVLNAVAKYTGRHLTRMIKGLYLVIKDPVGVLTRFARSKINTIRMVLDGLFKAGLNFARGLKIILVNVKDGFREGFFKGLVALGHSVVDIMEEALKLAGALAGLTLATLLDILGGHREMTALEKREARKVFGSSIDLSRVKISEASLAADLINLVNNPDDPGARPFTTMYVLNFASWKKVDLSTLMHELAHTWQGVVVGPIYMAQALHAQFTEGPDAYEVKQADLRANNGDFSKFNREQQASIVEFYYNYKFGPWVGRTGASTWITDLEPYAKQVFKPVRQRVRFNRLVPTAVFGFKPILTRVPGN